MLGAVRGLDPSTSLKHEGGVVEGLYMRVELSRAFGAPTIRVRIVNI